MSFNKSLGIAVTAESHGIRGSAAADTDVYIAGLRKPHTGTAALRAAAGRRSIDALTKTFLLAAGALAPEIPVTRGPGRTSAVVGRMRALVLYVITAIDGTVDGVRTIAVRAAAAGAV